MLGDRFGLGYYFIDFSDDFPALLDISHEHGVELFYNIEITPWLHITPDIQLIMNPGGRDDDRDPALVYGMRAQIQLLTCVVESDACGEGTYGGKECHVSRL